MSEGAAGSATAEVEMEGEPVRKPRTRSNSRNSDCVGSPVPLSASSANNDADIEGPQCPASPARSTRSRRGKGEKDGDVLSDQFVGEEGLTTPTTPKAKSTRIRRSSKSEIESILKDSSQNINESALAYPPPSPSSSSSTTGTVTSHQPQSPVVRQERKATAGRGGGRGGRKIQQPRRRKTGSGNEAGVTYDDLDFHSSWFASMNNPNTGHQIFHQFGPYLEAAAVAEELPNMPPNYLSRDLMLQLNCNISNGLAYVDQAFEAVRLGAQELCNAKVTLDRIYRNQQRNLEENQANNMEGQSNVSNTADIPQSSVGGPAKAETVSDQAIAPQVLQGVATAESFLVNVDPFQYLHQVANTPGIAVNSTVIDDIHNAVIYGKGQRLKREAVEDLKNSTTKKRRKGRPPKAELTSKYNNDLAMSDIQTLLNHLKATNVKGYKLATVNAADIRPTLCRMRCTRPNVYSAKNVLAALKRKEKRKKPTKSSSYPVVKAEKGSVKKHNTTLPERRKVEEPEDIERIMRQVHGDRNDPNIAASGERQAALIPSPEKSPSDSVLIRTTDTNNNPNSIKRPTAPAIPGQSFQNDITNDLKVAAIAGPSNPKANNNIEPSGTKCRSEVTESAQNNNTYEESDTEEERDQRTKKVFLPQFDRPLVAHPGYNDEKIEIPTNNGNNLLNACTDDGDNSSTSSSECFQLVRLSKRII